MTCPVCSGSTDEPHSLNADAKAIRCSTCGEFDVSETALAVLPQMDDYHRLQALRYAQTNALAGRHPYISGIT